MKLRTVEIIDYRINRLEALKKRLKAERRLALLREKQRQVKFQTSCLEGSLANE